jgi:hypothetical protein
MSVLRLLVEASIAALQLDSGGQPFSSGIYELTTDMSCEILPTCLNYYVDMVKKGLQISTSLQEHANIKTHLRLLHSAADIVRHG